MFKPKKHLHVECKLEFCLSVRVVDLEEAVNKLSQVHIPARVQVKHSEKALTNDSRQLTVLIDTKIALRCVMINKSDQ